MVPLAATHDPLAERRYALAMEFCARGDFEAAADLLQQAMELAPGWAALPFRLGEVYESLGRGADAVHAFRRSLDLDPADTMGAIIKLSLLGAEDSPEALPLAYVEMLFDQYAPRFEGSLVERLDYRVPQFLKEAAAKVRAFPPRSASVLDLGCGTGLAGVEFASIAARLEGVDLSAGMLAEAEKKGIYDDLRQADLLEDLGAAREPYDLILAADVLIYLGALEPVFTAVRRRLAPGGLFAFSLQRLEEEGTDFRLGGDCRYSYGEAYARICAGGAGLTLALLENAVLRQDRGQDVPGLIGVAVAA